MKKTLLSMVALLVAGHAAMAQNGLTEIPDPDGSQFMCTVLSPNGKYIGGVCYGVNAGFIFDVRGTEDGEIRCSRSRHRRPAEGHRRQWRCCGMERSGSHLRFRQREMHHLRRSRTVSLHGHQPERKAHRGCALRRYRRRGHPMPLQRGRADRPAAAFQQVPGCRERGCLCPFRVQRFHHQRLLG